MSDVVREPRHSFTAMHRTDRLESWKEIAAHLNRDISTVQRWEKKEGLPIHRLPHDKVGSVFAFKSELDAWVNRSVHERERVPVSPLGTRADQARTNEAPVAGAQSTRGTLRPAGLLSRTGVAGILIATVSGLATVWLGFWPRVSTPKLDVAPEIRFQVHDPPLMLNPSKANGDAPVAVSQNGSVFVYVGSENGTERLYQRRLGEVKAVPIPGTDNAVAPFISPDGEWIGFTRFADAGAGARLQKVALAGGAPVTICEIGGSRGASWGSDGTIVFAPHPDSGLWQVPATGGIPQPLTRPDPAKGERSHRYPFFIPDRRLVLYTIAQSDITSFDDAVVAIRDVDTGEDTQLIRGGSYPMYIAATGHLVYARAGTLLAAPLDLARRTILEPPETVLTDVITFPFTGAAVAAISNTGVLVSATGGAAPKTPTRVLRVDRQGTSEPIPFPPAPIATVRIARDQHTVAMEIDGANSAIWLGDMGRGTAARLTPEWTHWSPVWSPDGTQIASTSGRGGGRNLFVQRVDRPAEPERLTTSDRTNFVTAWSSDGRYLAYDDQTSTAARDVVIFDLKVRQSIPFIHSPADEYYGRFSPDGTLIAFVSNESGRPEVYLQTFPQPTLKMPVSLGQGGTNPVWARHGGELFYRNGDAVMAVDVQPTPRVTVGSPRVLFRKRTFTSDFDVTDDGHFVMVETSETRMATSFTVTVNWRGISRERR
jgi:serine/threonine-protein kinase